MTTLAHWLPIYLFAPATSAPRPMRFTPTYLSYPIADIPLPSDTATPDRTRRISQSEAATIRKKQVERIARSSLPMTWSVCSMALVGFYAYPLTMAGYRASVAHDTKDAVPFVQRYKDLSAEKNPGVWTLTVGHEGFLEALSGSLVQLLTASIIQRWLPKLQVNSGVQLPPETLQEELAMIDPDPLDNERSPWFQNGILGLAVQLLSAVVRGVITRPLVLARIRCNSQIAIANVLPYYGQTHAIDKIYKTEGWSPFTRSLGLSVAITVASCFLRDELPARRNIAYSAVTRLPFVHNSSAVLSTVHSVFVGISAVIETATPLVLLRPLEVVLRRIDMQGSGMEELLGIAAYGGVVECAKTILKQEGVAGFYKGLPEELLRDVPIAFFGAMLVDFLLVQQGNFRPKTHADW
eukprot:TRINITY_DN6692_c0_g1_i1.p1 TRINITY_DN6692_c0_g1~~TRINITY_DN6692_c0_g1_i1.p1  ORF type:complete len:409 (-),score=41.32 TRINITY_DN6692_c0_g1_i1:76-1302(-)